jgi:adenylylsulfate kinase-like enzyme
MKAENVGVVVWITGLSGSGKTNLTHLMAGRLKEWDIPSLVLNGDELRQGLRSDLGYSLADRSENVRRVGEVADQIFSSA